VRVATRVLSAVMIVVGLTAAVRSLFVVGISLTLFAGLLIAAAGAGRLYLELQR
jgi:hypothetical protein